MNNRNEEAPEYSLPEGTIEEISKTFDKAYDTAIDHAIKIAMSELVEVVYGKEPATKEAYSNDKIWEIIKKLEKLKK